MSKEFGAVDMGGLPARVGVGGKISEVNSDDFEIEWAASYDGTEPPSLQAVGHNG